MDMFTIKMEIMLDLMYIIKGVFLNIDKIKWKAAI